MNLQAAAPLLILSLGVGALLLIIAAHRAALLAAATAGLSILAALASIFWAIHAPAAAGLFIFDAQFYGFIALILGSALLLLLIATAYWQNAPGLPREEFSLLLLIGTLGAVALAAASGFIALFLGLETMTLAMIGMIAYPRFRPQAEEAGLKYLILSGMSSAFLLFGIGLIELASGSLGFAQLLAWVPPDAASRAMLLAGIAMLGVGAGFKLSVVPFHIWVPDIYGGAPAPSGGYVAVIAKIAVLAVVMRVLGTPGAMLPRGMADAVTLIAILSMLTGNLLALMQDNIKRILGYSSIAHLGYLLVALLAAGAIGRLAVIFYLVTYAITMIAAFGVIAMLSSANEVRDADNLADLRGLFWTRPALASVMTLVLLSLAGIPPAIGFIAKMYIMAAGVHTQLWGLTAVMVASSVIGLFYYLNILLAMTMKPGEGAPLPAVPLRNRLGMALVGLPVLGFGIAPEPLMALLRAVFG